VASLPLPAAAPHDPDLAALARAGARGRPVQDALDEHAAHLLGLSTEARRVLLDLDRRHADDRR